MLKFIWKSFKDRAYFNTEVINYAWIQQSRAFFNTEVINYA